MENTNKKFSTVIKEALSYENILGSFVGAIGYGFGYSIPDKLGMHPIICLVLCMLLGSLFDDLAGFIFEKKHLINTRKRKITFAAIIYTGYLIAWLIAYVALDYDIDNDFLLDVSLVLVFQVVSYILARIKRLLKRNINRK